MSGVETIDVRTTTREEMIDVTSLVRAAVKRSGVSSGIAVVFCPHTTAGVAIQENTDPTVRSDMLRHIAKLVPRDADYDHGEDNQDAHIKSSLLGQSISLVVDGGKVLLGHWQAVFFCELDGPRQRKLLVRVVTG